MSFETSFAECSAILEDTRKLLKTVGRRRVKLCLIME